MHAPLAHQKTQCILKNTEHLRDRQLSRTLTNCHHKKLLYSAPMTLQCLSTHPYGPLFGIIPVITEKGVNFHYKKNKVHTRVSH